MIIPGSTGVARALGKFILQINAMAFCITIPNVSIKDLTRGPEKSAKYDDLKRLVYHASESQLKGMLDYSGKQVESYDFKGNS